jgi:hypothetical protein
MGRNTNEGSDVSGSQSQAWGCTLLIGISVGRRMGDGQTAIASRAALTLLLLPLVLLQLAAIGAEFVEFLL